MIGLGIVLALLIVVGVVVLGVLQYTTQAQLRQLRAELDQTQRQVNELIAAAAAAVAAPPLPRQRSSGLDDLRQQLREAHRAGEDAGPE